MWLQVDATGTGLRGSLLQDGQLLNFTSSPLSATEVNYSPIETECLAIKVTCTKFYQPLETIFKKPLSKAPMETPSTFDTSATAVQVHSSLQERRVHVLGRYTV